MWCGGLWDLSWKSYFTIVMQLFKLQESFAIRNMITHSHTVDKSHCYNIITFILSLKAIYQSKETKRLRKSNVQRFKLNNEATLGTTIHKLDNFFYANLDI